MAVSIDLELAKRGQKESREGIVQQLRLHIQLAKDYEKELAEFGWTTEHTAKLEALLAKLESQVAIQAEAKDQSRHATLDQNAAFSEAKAFKRKLDLAVRRLFRKEKDPGVTIEAFEAGGVIGDSVVRLSSYLLKARPAVEKVKAKLLMGLADPLAELDRVKSALEGADTVQERKLQDLPEDTQQVYEAKGAALVEMADLLDTGRTAFDGNAVVKAKFNKDLIIAARKERKKAPPPA